MSPELPTHPGAFSNGVTPPSSADSGALSRKDFGKFVQFFRQASAYIKGHRGRTFVVVIPGEVLLQKELMHSVLEDITLLHGLGIQLVLVLSVTHRIDEHLKLRGLEPKFRGGYRITDAAGMQAALEAAGASRLEVEAYLSKAPAVSVVRRHERSSADQQADPFHYGPALRVISGNYVTGKRRGVVDGVDFGATGAVRFVQVEAIKEQLELGHIALLSNLAFTAAGEVLNCNTYDVATHAAIELGADKLFCLNLDEVSELRLPQWLPLRDAEHRILEHLAARTRSERGDNGTQTADGPAPSSPWPLIYNGIKLNSDTLHEIELNLDSWQAINFPNSVLASIVACKNGVKRAHLVDARIDGGLLLELYSRDGVGTMISADFYEGIRQALPHDLESIAALLQPLEAAGIVRPRTTAQLLADLPSFTVVEREDKVLACALVSDIGTAPDGMQCGELGAFCVHPAYRGSGRGDSLLDYVEQAARNRSIKRLVLLTTRTADWFEQRDFEPAGPAHLSALLPEERRARIDPARNSQLYFKNIVDLSDTVQQAPAGKRIGF
ncbi:hypothetical protein WJX72_009159 [[Myrmecia] bisecta]|uniref:amino-acid N-acetyltransferase n=1 Tax=[Myrmecia] bisecta TaxID=41462 RepID=A0AAW1QT58_9CHLO